MKIYIDKFTDKVAGINLATPSSAHIEIEVSDDFDIAINKEIQDGMKQKTNENREGIFIKEVYRTETKERVIGQDETLEDTGNPVMIDVQKKDEDGNKLYLEPLKNSDGEIIDYAEVTKSTDEDGTALEPVMLTVQKLSKGARPLFWLDIVETYEEQVLDHEEETTEDTGMPVIIPNITLRYIKFSETPELFNLDDVLAHKFQSILDASDKDYIIADMFLDEDDLDLADPNHSANTGVGFLQLLANGGQVKTKSISLEKPSTDFMLLDSNYPDGVEIYLSGKKFVDGKLTLATAISNCTIKFVNTTNRPKLIKSYAIGY